MEKGLCSRKEGIGEPELDADLLHVDYTGKFTALITGQYYTASYGPD